MFSSLTPAPIFAALNDPAALCAVLAVGAAAALASAAAVHSPAALARWLGDFVELTALALFVAGVSALAYAGGA